MRNEVESLVANPDRQAQVRKAGQAWQLARDRICALSSPVSSVAKQPAKPAPSAQGPVNLLLFTNISIEGRLKPMSMKGAILKPWRSGQAPNRANGGDYQFAWSFRSIRGESVYSRVESDSDISFPMDTE